MFDGRRGAPRATIAALVLIGAGSMAMERAAAAEDGGDAGPSARGPWKRLELSVAGYALSNGATLRIDAGDGTFGDPLDVERQLKVDKTLIRVRVDGRVRIGRRHTFQAAYYDGSRGGTARLSEEPVIGGRVSYSLSPKWRLRGEVDWFRLRIGDISGSLIDVLAGVDVDITRNFGLTARYNYVNIGVNSRDTGFPGRISYRYSAALLGGRLYF